MQIINRPMLTKRVNYYLKPSAGLMRMMIYYNTLMMDICQLALLMSLKQTIQIYFTQILL